MKKTNRGLLVLKSATSALIAPLVSIEQVPEGTTTRRTFCDIGLSERDCPGEKLSEREIVRDTWEVE